MVKRICIRALDSSQCFSVACRLLWICVVVGLSLSAVELRGSDAGLCGGIACGWGDEATSSLPAAEQSRHHEVYLRGSGVQRGRRLQGTIEDMPGEALIFRTIAGNRERLRIGEIAELRFGRSPQWEEGLALREAGDVAGAAKSIRAAMGVESRAWALRELRGMLAGLLREQGAYEECLEEVQRILDSDADSRHVIEIPLVWDEQVPVVERMPAGAVDLESKSELRRLIAASSLLGRVELREACEQEFRQQMLNGRGTLKQLAEIQTWRSKLLAADELTVFEVDGWQDRSQEFARPVRAAAAIVVAQADLLLHREDRALEGFLWCALVGAPDRATNVIALNRALAVMERTGRTGGAAVMERELRRVQTDGSGGEPAGPMTE